jgi:hypothetical protein
MPRFLTASFVLLLTACGPFDGDPTGPGTPPPGGGGPTVAVPFRIGSTNPEESRAIAVTATGIVVASWFSGTLDFDPRTTSTGRTSLGAQDVAVAKYDFDGAFEWVYSLGGTGGDVPNAIAATPDGGTVVVGYGSGGGVCGGQVLTGPGGRDVLIVKLSAGGACEWAHLLGGPEDDEGRSVAVAPDGSIVVVGHFRGTADFDPSGGAALLVSRGSSDAFVASYDPDGTFLGRAQGGGPEDDHFAAVTVAADGDITVAGQIRGTATFGSTQAPAVLVSVGGGDIAIARYTELFGLLWAERAGGTAEDRASAIAEDASGDVLVAGTFEGTADLDPGIGAALVLSQGAADVFVSRYHQGSGAWGGIARAFGGLGSEGVTGLVSHVGDRMVLTGWFQGSVDFDPGSGARIVNAKGTGGGGDAFTMAFGSSGNFAWVSTAGGVVGGEGLISIAYGLALDLDGTVWTVGRFYGRADFDPGEEATELTASGDSDAFVARYTADIGALRVTPLPE